MKILLKNYGPRGLLLKERYTQRILGTTAGE